MFTNSSFETGAIFGHACWLSPRTTMSVCQAAFGCHEINADTIDNFPWALLAGQGFHFCWAASRANLLHAFLSNINVFLPKPTIKLNRCLCRYFCQWKRVKQMLIFCITNVELFSTNICRSVQLSAIYYSTFQFVIYYSLKPASAKCE